jgi:hypothetical protein
MRFSQSPDRQLEDPQGPEAGNRRNHRIVCGGESERGLGTRARILLIAAGCCTECAQGEGERLLCRLARLQGNFVPLLCRPFGLTPLAERPLDETAITEDPRQGTVVSLHQRALIDGVKRRG